MNHIVENIIAYLNTSNSEGSFHVKGEWGSGKTYFFKEILPDKIKGQVDRIQVMISLFGLESVKEIPFKLLNAYVNKKSELKSGIGKDMDRGLDFLDMKYGVDRKLFGLNLHDEDELIYNIIPQDEVYLCFDDVERFVTKDNVAEILGTINNLVENLGYKVIVISNDHYNYNDKEAASVKSLFKEKVIGSAMTFIPSIKDIYNSVVDKFGDEEFSAFMKRDDVLALFLPHKRHNLYRKGFENIRNIKFAMSNFHAVFDHYRDSVSDGKTVKSLKYYLAFIIGVSIEYKKDILTDSDCHGIDIDTDVFNLSLDDDDSFDKDVTELFDEMASTPDEKDKLAKEEKFNEIYRKRFYRVYAKDVNQTSVFHEELYNNITKGYPINFEKLEDNLKKKVYDNEQAENPGNVVVAQTLDGTIFNFSDEEIKNKMLTLLSTVEDSSLKYCAAYVNAFSFLDMYSSVIGKDHGELLEIFKKGFSKYISNHEIDRMEGIGMEMVAQSIPLQTKDFYDYLKEELHKKWETKQNQEIEEMIILFNTDVPKFCGLFSQSDSGVTSHYITEAVLQNVPEDVVEKRMHTLNPKDVHVLANLVSQRYILQDIYSFHLQKENGFLAAMKSGIESIEGDDAVSKVEAKNVLLFHVNKAIKNLERAK